MIITKSSTRLVATAAGVAVALALLLGASMPTRAAALSQTQVQSILNLLSSFGADAATISNVQNALNGLPSNTTTTTTTTTTGSTAGVCPFTWSTNLKVGSTGQSIMKLQQFLNMDSSTMVAASGAGSPGSETSYFGGLTKTAVMKFQTKYGIDSIGLVGPITRAKLNSLCTVAVTPTPVTPVPVTPGVVGTATVTAGAQPANSIAPINAARVPFTAFTVTAGASPVTLNNVTVMRQGPSVDQDFAGVVLIDTSTGIQVGISRVLDSNHSATIGAPILIPAGSSKTFLVAGNIGALGTVGSGDIASFAVTAVNTTATVSGALPIIGASNTINGNLVIGSATIQSSSFDPNTSSSQPIGTTAYRFTGFRIQAGSVEDVSFKSITWNQQGSASGLQNVVTVVNGTSYPAVVDSTGRYYSTVFPTPITVLKGASVDVYVQADLGANTTSNSTAEFDVYRNTDIYIVGNQYGYGITPTGTPFGTPLVTNPDGTHATAFFGGTNNPFLEGSMVKVTAGQFSTIQNASGVPAQNIAINVANQPLGGFNTNLTGEAINVQSLKVHFTSSSPIPALTNVSLVSSNGGVIAGPFNAVCDAGAVASGVNCGSNVQTVTFSGSLLFPTGSATYTLKGQVGSGAVTPIPDGTTIRADTNPSTDWGSITGNTTGTNVVVGVTDFQMNTMTIKAASLVVGNSSTPTSQTIVAGGQNILFANIQLDATQSGEDVRLTAIPMTLITGGGGNATNVSSCQFMNNGVALNTGSRVINSTNLTNTASQNVNFSLDNSLTIVKGSKVTLALTCSVSSSAAPNSTFQWTTNPTPSTFSVSGVTSGNQVVAIINGGVGPTMTVSGTGTVLVTTDSNSPAYAVVAGGTTGVRVNTIKFHATSEDIDLQKIGLNLSNTASSSPADVTNVSLYAGNGLKTTAGATIPAGQLIGTASFTGNATTSTSTLSTPIQLPRDTDSTIDVKVDLSVIGLNQAVPVSGHLVAIDYINSEGTGHNSGQKVVNSGLTSAKSNGVRVMKAWPVFTYDTTNVVASNGNQVLLTLNVAPTGQSGDINLNQLTFRFTPTTATLTAVTLSGPTGNVSQAVNITPGANTIVVPFDSSSNTADRTVSVGSTKTYTLRGNIALTGTNSTGSINIALAGDTAYPILPTGQSMGTAAQLSAQNMIWSPNSTTSPANVNSQDWTNGFGLTGGNSCFSNVGLGNDCNIKSISK